MGTRNSTLVKLNGELKVAQYGQWDGYPSGQGLTVLKFCKNNNLQVFAEKLKDYGELTDKDIDKINLELKKTNKSLSTLFPEYCRDTAADILEMIMQDKVWNKKLQLAKEYYLNKHGGYTCEWAYMIDLDENKLKVFSAYRDDAEFDLDNLPTITEFLRLEGGDEEE